MPYLILHSNQARALTFQNFFMPVGAVGFNVDERRGKVLAGKVKVSVGFADNRLQLLTLRTLFDNGLGLRLSGKNF